MKSTLALAALLAVIPAAAFAQAAAPDAGSISDKVMKDEPGTKGGTTVTPTAKADDSSISTKEMKDLPATKSGTTANPTAKPADGLSDKVMKDQPGTK